MKKAVLGINLGVSQTSLFQLPYINTEIKIGLGSLIVITLVLLVTVTEQLNVIPVDQVPSCPALVSVLLILGVKF